MTFPKSLYHGFIARLQSSKYSFVLPRNYAPSSRKVVVLRHDIDLQTQGVENLLEVEREANVKSAFYLRPHQDYFPQNIQLFQKLERDGWEVGLHYDCLSRCNGDESLAQHLFSSQVTFMRCFFDVATTTAHGDNYRQNINNLDLFNTGLWSQLGLRDFTDILGACAVADTWNRWHEPKELGNIVLVNLHADWW